MSLALNRHMPIVEKQPPEKAQVTSGNQVPQASARAIAAMRLAISRLGEDAPRHQPDGLCGNAAAGGDLEKVGVRSKKVSLWISRN